MAGMRDVIVHGYFAVTLEIIWTTIHSRFPRERERERELLAKVLQDVKKT